MRDVLLCTSSVLLTLATLQFADGINRNAMHWTFTTLGRLSIIAMVIAVILHMNGF